MGYTDASSFAVDGLTILQPHGGVEAHPYKPSRLPHLRKFAARGTSPSTLWNEAGSMVDVFAQL